jgi:membrane protein
LAAGIGYFAFFSLFPALALAAVVFGFVLQGRPDLLQGVGDALNTTLPGFVKTAGNPTGVVELSAPPTATLSLTGVIAAVTLVLSGLGWVGSLRDGIRAVFGVAGAPGNAVTAKLRDLGVFVLLGASVLASAVLTSVVGGGASWVAQQVGLGGHGWLATSAGALVGLVVNTAVMVLLLRVLSGVALPWRQVRSGALLGGFALTALQLLGGQLIARATSSPLFGSVVVVVGLLFWVNLMAKVVLLCAAWSANNRDASLDVVDPGGPLEDTVPRGHPRRYAAAATEGDEAAARRERAANGIPTFGQRSADRTTLAAGAIVGAGLVGWLGATRRAVRAVLGRR